MRRPPILFMILLMVVSVIAACGDNTLEPDSAQVVANLDSPEKRITLPELNGPMDTEIFLFILDHNFDTINWEMAEVVMPVWDGGTVSVQIPGYPEDKPVEVTIAANKYAPNEFETGIIFVPAALPAGAYLDIPGDCILYRTLNIPPDGLTTAIVNMPIMDWNRTDVYNGSFTTYDLYPINEDESEAYHVRQVTIPWVEDDPDRDFYVEALADPHKDGVDHIIDRVVDPQDLGDEESVGD